MLNLNQAVLSVTSLAKPLIDAAKRVLNTFTLKQMTELIVQGSLLIRTDARASEVASALAAQPALADSVRRLDLRFAYRENGTIDKILPWIKKMHNLQDWSIESPWSEDPPSKHGGPPFTEERFKEEEADKWQHAVSGFREIFVEAAEHGIEDRENSLASLESC
jgi:hypothetical protein